MTPKAETKRESTQPETQPEVTLEQLAAAYQSLAKNSTGIDFRESVAALVNAKDGVPIPVKIGVLTHLAATLSLSWEQLLRQAVTTAADPADEQVEEDAQADA